MAKTKQSVQMPDKMQFERFQRLLDSLKENETYKTDETKKGGAAHGDADDISRRTLRGTACESD